MADDVVLNPGVGGATCAADDIGPGVLYQRIKLTLGADGVNDGDVASGNPMPVTGTVTANLGATDNAVLDDIAAQVTASKVALEIIDDWDESDRAKVNLIVGQAGIAAGAGAVGVTVPRVTLASDDPAVVSLQLLDNAISGAGFNITQLGGAAVPIGAGTEAAAIRVTLPTNGTGIVGLAAGSNAIGKLAANSGIDIGDVDVTSIIPGTGATNLGKAEDAAHSSGDVGVMMLAVRAAAPTERSAGPTDGDYEPLAVNEVGAQWVTSTPSANGGCSTKDSSGIDSGGGVLTNAKQTIKASAGVLYGYYIYNPNSSAAYVHVYNTDTVTVGTTPPMFCLCIPATSAANLALPYGIAFSTAISWAAATTANGSTAPTTGLEACAWYK